MRSGVPLYQLYEIDSDGQLFTGPCRVMGIICSPDQVSSDVHLHDSLTSDNEIIDVHALNGASNHMDFTSYGGIAFNTGVYVTLTGTNAEAFIWIDG